MEEIRVAGKSIEVLVKKGTIDFDFELIKSQLEEVLKMYGGCVFNEDNLPGAKKEIADLRKQQKALERYKVANNLADAVLFINQYEKQKADILRMEQERKAEEERKAAEPVITEEVEEPLKDFGHVFEPQQAEEFKLCYQYTIKATKRELETIDTFLDSIGVDWSK